MSRRLLFAGFAAIAIVVAAVLIATHDGAPGERQGLKPENQKYREQYPHASAMYQRIKAREERQADKPSDTHGCPSGSWHPVEARLFNDPAPVGGGSSEAIRLTNGWTAGNHCVTTLVNAGVLIYEGHHGNGSISISHFLPDDSGPSGTIEIPGSGPIQIIGAPLGEDATADGGVRGDVRFRSATGLVGVLHLEDCSVELEPPTQIDGIKVEKCPLPEGLIPDRS